MGIKKTLWIIAGLLGFASCQWGVPHNNTKPAITKDTLVYTYQTIKERAPDCGNKPDSACSLAKITYPVFTGQASLSDTIKGRLLATYSNSDKPDKTLDEQAKNFIGAYMDDTVHKNNPEMLYVLESTAAVVRQDSSLITVQIDRYAYAGGAHGGTYTGFLDWDTKANKKIALKDIFVPGYNAKLTAIAEKVFRADEKLSDTSSLRNYFFKDEQFSLTDNFLITPVGIQFLYNEYEIKSYAEGQTTLLIPYTQIKSLLRPNTVLKQYIK
ncbi:MAG: DUF3298 domain-containing protein [Mucilaginibacter sp.]